MYLQYLLSSKEKNNVVSVKIIFAFAQSDIRKDDEYHAGIEPDTSWIQVAAEVCQFFKWEDL